jgi:hypothetical protein
LTRALGGLEALGAAPFSSGLKNMLFKYKCSRITSRKVRHRAQQYSAQGVQHGIHDFMKKEKPVENYLAE